MAVSLLAGENQNFPERDTGSGDRSFDLSPCARPPRNQTNPPGYWEKLVMHPLVDANGSMMLGRCENVGGCRFENAVFFGETRAAGRSVFPAAA
jgi:hypothetical protein